MAKKKKESTLKCLIKAKMLAVIKMDDIMTLARFVGIPYAGLYKNLNEPKSIPAWRLATIAKDLHMSNEEAGQLLYATVADR